MIELSMLGDIASGWFPCYRYFDRRCRNLVRGRRPYTDLLYLRKTEVE